MKGTWIISCRACGQEYSWESARFSDADTFKNLARAREKGDSVRLDEQERYIIGSNPMHGDRACAVCGSEAKNTDRDTTQLFAEVN